MSGLLSPVFRRQAFAGQGNWSLFSCHSRRMSRLRSFAPIVEWKIDYAVFGEAFPGARCSSAGIFVLSFSRCITFSSFPNPCRRAPNYFQQSFLRGGSESCTTDDPFLDIFGRSSRWLVRELRGLLLSRDLSGKFFPFHLWRSTWSAPILGRTFHAIYSGHAHFPFHKSRKAANRLPFEFPSLTSLVAHGKPPLH